MAFCTSCGGAVDTGARFCTKCGTTQATASATPNAGATTGAAVAKAPQPSAPTKSGPSGLKILLTIFIVVVVLIVAVIGVVVGGAMWIAHKSKVTQDGQNASIETPFGSIKTNDDPASALADLSVDVYPGATPVKGGVANVTLGNYSAKTVTLRSDDAPAKIVEFYKSQYPKAFVVSQDDKTTMTLGSKGKSTTISVEPEGEGSKLTIADVSGMR